MATAPQNCEADFLSKKRNWHRLFVGQLISKDNFVTVKFVEILRGMRIFCSLARMGSLRRHSK